MTKTKVKAHKRKGTKGVKKHPRVVTSKRKVPHTELKKKIKKLKRKRIKESIFRTNVESYLEDPGAFKSISTQEEIKEVELYLRKKKR